MRMTARRPTFRQMTSCLTLLILSLIIAGCGGGSPPQKTNVVRTPAVQSAPVAPPLVHTETNTPAATSPEKPAVTETSAAESQATADSNGEKPVVAIETELFAIKGEQIWKITGDVPAQERFQIVSRGDAKDSSQLEILSREPSSEASSRNLSGAGKPLPRSAQAISAAGFSPEGFPLRITFGANDPCEMALIPAGTYRRGSDSGPEEVQPEQTFALDAFYMDVTEVTVAQYERMREANQKGQRPLPQPSNALSDPRQPAVGISYGDALFYAKWAGKELPSEAQWEAAARGAEGYRFAWGNGRVVWEKPRGRNQIDPVGSYRADISPFGVLDLMGNAREWCKDKYAPTSYKEQSGHGLLRDPVFNGRAVPNGHQVVRGNGEDWSAWHRGHAAGVDRNASIGFRCVVRLTAGSETPVRESASPRDSKPKGGEGKGKPNAPANPTRPPTSKSNESF